MADDLERILSSEFTIAADKMKEAADSSLKAAKSARARARRERMTTRSQSMLPVVKPEERLEMPEDWKGDEDTRRIKTG